MKREHWPEVGWQRQRAWAEAWAGMPRWVSGLLQRSGSRAWVGRQRWSREVRVVAGAGDGVGRDGDGVGRRRLGLRLATATALALVLRGDESLIRDEGWWERSEGWRAWWVMRELNEMMKKKERGFRGQEHGRSWIKRNKRMIYVCIILIRELNKKSFFFF